MTRLIDADEIIYDIDEEGRAFVLAKDIDLRPTVDAVEVVRCKDCKFYDPLDANRPYDCMYMDSIFGDDYCSRGVKLPEPMVYPQVEGITPTVVKTDEVTE